MIIGGRGVVRLMGSHTTDENAEEWNVKREAEGGLYVDNGRGG